MILAALEFANGDRQVGVLSKVVDDLFLGGETMFENVEKAEEGGGRVVAFARGPMVVADVGRGKIGVVFYREVVAENERAAQEIALPAMLPTECGHTGIAAQFCVSCLKDRLRAILAVRPPEAIH